MVHFMALAPIHSAPPRMSTTVTSPSDGPLRCNSTTTGREVMNTWTVRGGQGNRKRTEAPICGGHQNTVHAKH